MCPYINNAALFRGLACPASPRIDSQLLKDGVGADVQHSFIAATLTDLVGGIFDWERSEDKLQALLSRRAPNKSRTLASSSSYCPSAA